MDDAVLSTSLIGGALVERIRSALVQGAYAPNQRLIESDLCEEYGASRAQVRAALHELATTGLVEVQRNKGARVRAVPIEEAIEITEVRMVLEGLSARKAAERITPEQAEDLLEIVEGMRDAFAKHELVTYSECNARLHLQIRIIAGHKTAADVVERLGAQVVRHQFQLALRPGRPAVSLPQHERIVQAIVARDPDEAEAAMRAHLSSVIQALSSTGEA